MIEYLEWDSEFFGISIGSVRTRITSEILLDSVLRDLGESSLNLLYLTVSIDRVDLVTRVLRERGAILADIRAEMSVDLLQIHSGQEVIESAGFLTRIAEVKDAVSAASLASRCFRGLTRFYRDPGLSNSRCDELYRIWAEKDIGNEGNSSMICTFEGRTAGFCTAVNTGNGNSKIGLIGVDPEFRGHGVGQALLNCTAGTLRKKGIERLVAVTQMSSIGAVRMYERAGFRIRDAGIVVHLWHNKEGI
mgnify:CR=1 FL=1